MFKKETVMILGAGASKPYGYPTGDELLKDIIKNICEDSICLPLLHPNPRNYYWNHHDTYYLNDFIESLKKIKNTDLLQSGISIDLNPNVQHFLNAPPYIQTRLNRIKELDALQSTLNEHAPISIDSFLRDNPEHESAGRIMIIYSLLKYEDENAFSMDNKNNWYSNLIEDVLNNWEQTTCLLNNLNIITFNYSLDLLYCLAKKLSLQKKLKNNLDQNKIIDCLKQKIHHVYGQLYVDDPISTYGEFSNKKDIFSSSTMRFIKSINSRNNIKLIRKNQKIETFHSDLIKNAKEIIIIGFSFQSENLEALGFLDGLQEDSVYLKGKTVKYLDYNGEMKNIWRRLSPLADQPNDITIIRSTDTSIKNAYKNDF